MTEQKETEPPSFVMSLFLLTVWIALGVPGCGMNRAYNWNQYPLSMHNRRACQHDAAVAAGFAVVGGPIGTLISYFSTGFAMDGYMWTCPAGIPERAD